MLVFFACAAFALGLSASQALGDEGGGRVIYDSTVSPLPGNLPSEGPEAYAFTEFGDEVTFAGNARMLKKVTLTLSSWGCQAGHWYTLDCVTSPGATFTVPITFNIYNPPASGWGTGALIATKTHTFAVPYRPSADSRCTGGRWFKRGQGCFNGLAHNVTFNFQHVELPNTVVYGITYNTSHYGPVPIGEGAACYTSSGGCPYDSLNIALGPLVKVGSKPYPDTVYQNTAYGSNYCDGGTNGVGTFRLDSPGAPCWGGYVPAVQFAANRRDDDDDVGGGGGGGGDD
jgi:hypothetical protein